ncbi:MAG TPA: hypothetical protein VFS67_21555 [Polyangiaceae bacterium]|nr:hypothetical protein [Polyangiaceae bacterium]
MSPSRAAPSLALAAYAETWISGAKVVVFGDSLSPLPERLVERGARLVQVYDRDPARCEEAAALSRSRQISYAPFDNAGAIGRDGAFDFGIVEELGAKARGDELATLRRALGRRGMALIAARNPELARSLIPVPANAEEPLGYYELYELVSQHFEEVRMLGQTAFVGYAVADFAAAEDSDVRLDTAFLPGGAEEPEWFLALVSTLPVASEAFSVIQLPLADLPQPAAADRDEIERLEQALERAEARAAELERARTQQVQKDPQKDAAQQRQDQQRQELQRQKEALERQLESLQAEIGKREHWLKGLEARAATADQRADDAQAELEQLGQREAAAVARSKQLEQQLEEALRAKRSLEDGQVTLRRELEELKHGSGAHARSYAELERRAIALSTKLDELKVQLEASEKENRELRAASQDESNSELRELEAQLVERGKEVARLERELEQTERFGRQLIAQLEQARARDSEPPPDLERLARRNAELEADLEAARWTISSLGTNVHAAAGAGARHDDGALEDARRSAD